MAVAPVALLFMVLGLFFLLEVKAERIADPETLSTRVRSEVYALPPLPTAPIDSQIECTRGRRPDRTVHPATGSPSICGLWKSVRSRQRPLCVDNKRDRRRREDDISVSARGPVRPQGMSTLLIDADFRRSTLCTLLDVPEGLGLSDVLKDEPQPMR